MTPSVSSPCPRETGVEKTKESDAGGERLPSGLPRVDLAALASMLRRMAPDDQESLSRLL